MPKVSHRGFAYISQREHSLAQRGNQDDESQFDDLANRWTDDGIRCLRWNDLRGPRSILGSRQSHATVGRLALRPGDLDCGRFTGPGCAPLCTVMQLATNAPWLLSINTIT